MAGYDPLRAGWQAHCPHQPERVLLTLHQFRTIQRLAGPERPPAYMVSYACPCEERHSLLLTQDDLDLAPMSEPLSPHFDLMVGRMDWQADGVAPLWEAALRRGRWPLTLRCPHEAAPVAAWPSLLSAIEPDSETAPRCYLVHYVCPVCDNAGCEQWAPHRLSLAPAVPF